MEFRKITIAIAAFSFAGAAAAMGNQATNTTKDQSASRDQTYSSQQAQQASPGASSASAQSNQSANGSEHDPALVRSAQQALKQKGFDVGSIDGQLGPNTESAIRDFQQAQGLPQSGSLDQQTLSALGVEQNAQGQGSMSQGAAQSGSTSQGAMSSQGSSNAMQNQGSTGSQSQESTSQGSAPEHSSPQSASGAPGTMTPYKK